MDVYVKIEFPTAVEYYSKEGGTLSGKQYLPYILNLSNLSLNMGDDHSFEISNITILFDDISDHFRGKLADDIDKYMKGSPVILYQSDGTKITTLKIADYKLLPDSKFEITCTNKIGELWNDFTEKITLEEFPAAPTDSVNQVIPQCYGEMEAGGGTGGTIKAWQVEANKYLVNDLSVASTLTAAYLSDGTDITASCAMTTCSNGTREAVSYSLTDPDYIIVDYEVTGYKSGDPQDALEDILNKFVTFNSGNYTSSSDLEDFLENSGLYKTYFRYYGITEPKTGADVLKEFCDSFNVDWIINSDNEVEIKWVDNTDLTADLTIQQASAEEFPFRSEIDPEEYASQVIMSGHYNAYAGTYQKQYILEDDESTSLNGMRPVNINTPWIKTDESIVWSAKYYLMYNKQPRLRAWTSMYLDDWFTAGLEPGDLIEFSHEDDRLSGSGAVILYQIRKVSLDFTNNIVNLELWDIDYLKDINTEINLLIQSNYADEYLEFYDSSMRQDGDGSHILAPQLSVTHQDTQVLFGRTSVYNWGFRRITTPNASEWDIINTTGNSTISAYIYPHDLSSAYSDGQVIFQHYENSSNYWALVLQSAGAGSGSNGKLQFYVWSGGVLTENAVSTTALSTGQWYHVALCNVGGSVGLYINGTQEAFRSLAGSYDFDGTLYIFGSNQTTQYLQAYVSEAFISNDNFYGAAPVIGVTDTITPYWQPLTMKADNKILETYNPRAGDVWTAGGIYRVKWNVPGLNSVIELWTSLGSGGAKIADLGTAVNKQYFDVDTTGWAAVDRTIKVHSENLSDWSGVFTVS